MLRHHAPTSVLFTWLCLASISGAGQNPTHRVIVLDNVNRSANSGARLKLVEVETGKILASVTTGVRPDVAVSRAGDVVAVLTNAIHGEALDVNSHLELYRTRDLTLLGKGYTPFFGRTPYVAPHYSYLEFSPNGRELIIQKMMSYATDEKPKNLTVDQAWLATINIADALIAPKASFGLSHPPVLVPRCTALDFLSTEAWPRIHVWNPLLHALEVVDLDQGDILSRLRLSDRASLEAVDPQLHELARIGLGQYMSLMAPSGQVISQDGRTAFFVPRSGRLRKIALAANPPRVIQVAAEAQDDLQPQISAVSGDGSSLFVQVAKTHPNGATFLESGTLRVFDTATLKPSGVIDSGVGQVDYLCSSYDGRYMYALITEGKMLSIIDVKQKRKEKVLENVGDLPILVFPIP